MNLDRAVRRAIPSASRLTYNPIFKAVVDLFDWIPKLLFDEFSNIPPNHMRIRVGVGNRIFTNQVSYVSGGANFWMHVFHSGLCRLDSTIVDIGCGCGRYAHYLRDYRFKSERFSGKYIGIDIDDEMLAWCRKNFDPERFSFYRSNHASKAYRGMANGNSHYRLPVADASADFVYSTSLFTHLLETQLLNYMQESYRALKPGGHMAMYCFSMDHPPPTYGDRHTFRHQIGNAFVESQKIPEAAVAYREEFLLAGSREAGFRAADVCAAPGDWQPLLLCQK
ncbi:MAG TPA: class I SAM-dependent methyltransferase [Methylomirabilota bacterium]|nr:class I SAM-dependent methyltransferase [Methylomirabilota bacterium]